MNKQDFINTLENKLSKLPKEEQEDILYDYEEHFQVGVESGKTEDEISASLGSPSTIAKQYLASYKINIAETDKSGKNILGAILATLALGFFNLVFILGPFLGAVGVLIGFYGAAFGVTVAGGALILVSLFPALLSLPYVVMDVTFYPLLGFTLGAGLTSLGLLFFIGDIWLTKALYNLTVKYLKANIRLISR